MTAGGQELTLSRRLEHLLLGSLTGLSVAYRIIRPGSIQMA